MLLKYSIYIWKNIQDEKSKIFAIAVIYSIFMAYKLYSKNK